MTPTPTLCIRYLQISLGLCFCFYFLIVAINNCLDYRANLNFVQHVLTMDTTFSPNRLRYRAIENHFMHNFVFLSIIMWEFIVAIFMGLGSYHLIRALHSVGKIFQASKSLLLIGFNLSILLWFYAFIIVGGEWFLMWQSSQWNGKSTAFNLLTINLLAVIILLREEPSNTPPPTQRDPTTPS